MASPEARAGAIVRPAARVLLLDPLGRVLLLRVERPYGLPYAAWLTPGGGLEPGESHEEAALRELREETGITGVELGPWVWERRFHFSRGVVYCNLERYYVARIAFEPRVQTQGDDGEGPPGHRWWGVRELASLREPLLPPRLPEFLPEIIAGHYPARVLDITEEGELQTC